MSLVSEALKKAQREAAQREARDKGLPEPLLAGAQPFRARRARRAQPLAAAAAVVLAAAAGLYLWRSSVIPAPAPDKLSVEGNRGPVVEIESAKAVPVPAPSTQVPAEAQAAPVAVTAAAAGVVPAAPPAITPSAAALAPPPPSLEVPGRSSAAPAAAVAPAPPPPAPQAQPPAGRPAAAADFVRVARLAGGAEIRLGGIAWSEAAPLAYVNGRLVGIGESVAGCAVRAIERERVSLSCAGEAVRIGLR